MKIKRLNGNFPIFANKASFGQVKDLDGSVYDPINWNLPERDSLKWDLGLLHNKHHECFKSNESITPEKLNGILNFITNSIAYLYEAGIPEYSVGTTYSKNSVVTHNGEILISLVDNNNKHPAILGKYWKGINTTTVVVHKENNPIGTILTVPKKTSIDGYIDYIEGHSFNMDLYPELFKALGSNVFGSTGSTIENSMPIGSLVYTLNTEHLPDGWIEWSNVKGILTNYPELKAVLLNMIRYMPIGSSTRVEWERALSTDSLPAFGNSFFLRKASMLTIGEYFTDNVNIPSFSILPLVIDNSNTLNPLGFTRKLYEERTYSPISSSNLEESKQETNIVITGQRVESYADLPKPVRTFNVGNSNNTFETYPKHLTARLLIKAKSALSNVSSTHKQIIKAFEV